MNYKGLSGIFATLLVISVGINLYQAYESKPSNPIESRQTYEKKVLDSEVRNIRNRETLRKLQERVEDLERKSFQDYFPKDGEYDTRRLL
jgi:hypothetical protein